MKSDAVLWSRELLSARDLADLTGRTLVPALEGAHEGVIEVPVTPEGVTIEFEPAKTDWEGADQVVVALYAPPEVQPAVDIRVDSGSSTPGLQGNDYVRCYYRYLYQGWGRLEFPYENMLIFGIPDRWREVSRVELRLGGQGPEGAAYQIASISIEERDRVRGPRLTDDELFAELDLERPGLGGVRERVQGGDLEGAKEALLAYMAARDHPRYPYPTTPSPVPGYDRTEADQICAHFILNQQLGAEIDWRANPIGYLEWMHAFNRHFFLQTLTDAYLATAEKKYARELDDLLSTWLDASPPPWENNGGGDPAWETLSTACRINRAWPRAWAALSGCPAFQPDTRIDMLKSFYEHAELLIRYPTGHNWLVAESAALATIGVLFPEFRKAEGWRSVGLERILGTMQFQVYPDGAQFELSPGYHRMCALLYADLFELAELNGQRLPRDFVQGLESMFLYTAHVTRPDGTRPSLNDAGALDTRSEPMLRRGQELFGRADLAYVASGGAEGALPEDLSRAFPYAGHYVMRTGWDRDALWALVDAGPYGAAHQHEDKLSLELYAYGTRFVVDPGIASYLDDPWTHWSRSTAAHSTVLVDGRGQDRRTRVPRSEYRVTEPGDALWGSGARLDYVWGAYEHGYQGLDASLGLVHRRLVLFLKPQCWVIWDLLQGRGEHEMSALYHLGPMLAQADAASGVVRSNRLGLPNIEFLPLDAPDRVEVICGRQDPVQGWLAVGEQRTILPAPVAVYARCGALPLSMGVVAAPFKSGATSGLRVGEGEAVWAASSRPCLSAAVVDAAGARYEVAWAAQPGEIACGKIGADAQGLVVHRGAGGQIDYAAALHARRLSVGGVPLAEGDERRALIEVEVR